MTVIKGVVKNGRIDLAAVPGLTVENWATG